MEDNKRLKLFVVSHKEVNKKLYPGRNFIFVGPNSDKIAGPDDYKDNNLINIASKNYTYCELTAIYYIYKNIEDYDYVGIEHYRRLFGFPSLTKLNHYSTKYLLNKLKHKDIITCSRTYHTRTMYKQWCDSHDEKYILALKEAIKTLYPEYLDAFNKVMNNHYLSVFNMFITDKATFKDYAKFVFDVLFYVEERIEIPTDPYQRRMMGFLGERLLDVYIIHNKLKVARTFVSYFGV